MQDGQISQTLFNPVPEYKPVTFAPSSAPIRASGGGVSAISTNPDLYEDAKIANQSGFTNWVNSFIQGVNETQIGVGASDLMDGLVKKANLEQKLNQLEADNTLGKFKNPTNYLQQKNSILTDLQKAYNDIQSARESIYEDKQDEKGSPISKSYQLKNQLTTLKGSNASLFDQFKYSLPNVMGSSAALMGATLTSGFIGKAVSTAVQRGVAGAEAGPWGAALGVISGLISTVGVNAYARSLESKAEVGSQFLQDYEDLRSDYAATKPPGYQLSEDEENKLILQASKGADDQYWKNMSLAISDSIQGLIMAGVVGKTFRGLTNANKLSRLAGIGAEFYVSKKLEGLEEGLQYTFQTDKSLASHGLADPASFGDALFRNYKDAIRGMSFLGSKPSGPFGEDQEFQANVNGGELLGGLFGGVHMFTNVVKDVNSYKNTTAELARLNPTKVDAPFLKFKDDLYAQFFGPKERGGFGLFSEDSEDRLFFFKEALKSLSKRTMDDGKPFLTKDELDKELHDVDTAYESFQSINKNLDDIMSPYVKGASKRTAMQKEVFRNELFHNTMALTRLNGEVNNNQAKMLNTLDTSKLNDVSKLQGQLEVINERLKGSFGNYEAFLNQQKSSITSALKSQVKLNDSLDVPNTISPIDQASYKAINDYYDSAETQYDYEQKRKNLSKVKSWNDLQSWARGYQKTAPESYLKNQEDAIVEDNKTYADGLLTDRKPIETLSEEDKKARTTQNKETLERAGFTKNYISTLEDGEMDKQAAKALEEFKNKVATVTDENILSTIISANTKDELLTYLSRPSIRAAFNRLGFDLNLDLEDLQNKSKQRLSQIQEEQRKNKIRLARPNSLQSRGTDNLISGRIKSKADTRETSDYENDFGIKNGKATQKSVLEAVILSNFSTEAEKELARKLLAITKDDDEILFRPNWRPVNKDDNRAFDSEGKPVNGNYEGLVRKPGVFSDNGTVSIDLGHFGDEYEGNQQEKGAPSMEATVLHELIHKYTFQAMKNSPETLAQVREIMLKAKQVLADEITKPSGNKLFTNNYYGVTNEYEFLAEAMTSPDFQRFLANIEGTGGKTLWQNFIDAVSNLLSSVFGIQVPGSLLEDAIALTTNIIEGKKTVNSVAAVEALTKDIQETLGKIDPKSKTAEQELSDEVNNLSNKIQTMVNENNLGDAIRKQLMDTLLAEGNALEQRILEAQEKAGKVEFQGKTFKKGDYVAIKGYPDPWYVENASSQALMVGNKENNEVKHTAITDVNSIEAIGDLDSVSRYLAKRDTKPEETKYKNNDSPDLYKSIGQQFDDRTGQFIEDNEPVTQRFYDFLSFANAVGIAKLGYRGLIVKDDDAVAGFTIPRSAETRTWLETHKPGEIVVIVDKAGNPVKLDSNFLPSESGDYVVFNIETPGRVMDRNTQKLADSRGITLAEAEQLKASVAQKIAAARKSAANGKPVFIDFKGISHPVSMKKAVTELVTHPITIEDAQRVVRLANHFSELSKNEKDKRQKVKDFLFNYIIGITPGSKISGGEVFIKGEKVVKPTADQIIENFDYKKVFDYIDHNNPYTVIDVNDGKLFTQNAFPSYTDYLKTITNLSSDITQSKYNQYLTYEIGEVKGESKASVDPTEEIKSVPESKPFDNKENIFDMSLSEDQGLTPDQQIIKQAIENDEIKGIQKEIAKYALESPEIANQFLKEVADQFLNKVAQEAGNPSENAKKVYGETIVNLAKERFPITLDSSLSESGSNELGLFNNQVTYELMRSLDKGVHNYLRKTSVKTIIGALEDRDFVIKALDKTKESLLDRLNQLRDIRKSQMENAKFSPAYYEAQITNINDRIAKINSSWDKIINYYFQNSEVFSYSKDLAYKYDEHGNLVQEGDDRVAHEKGFDTIGNEVSPIDGASKEVKALVRGLSKYKKIGNQSLIAMNSFNVPELVNFAPTWNNMLRNLQGLSTFEEMVQKLESLRSKFPEYGELTEILRSYYKQAQGDDFQAKVMVAKFYRDFSNPLVPIYEVVADLAVDNTTFKIDEATRKNVKDLRKLASSNFKTNSKFRAKTADGKIVLSDRILETTTISKQERADFLRGLGLEISQDTINDPAFDVVASQQIIRYLKDEIREIHKVKRIEDPVADISRQTANNRGQSKRLNDIINLESKYSQTAPTLSMQNVEGNTEHAISRPNFYSIVIRGINDAIKYPTFQDLVNDSQYEFLDKPNARTSIILNSIFVLDSQKNYGKRRDFGGKPITLDLTNVSGLTIEGGEGNKTTSLFIGDKIVQDFNQLLKGGFKEFMRAGDKRAAFGLKVSSFPQANGMGKLPISNLELFKGRNGYGGHELDNVMEKYLHGEIMRIYLGRFGYLDDIRKMTDKKDALAKSASLFRGILTPAILTELYANIESLGELEPNTKDFYDKTAATAKDFITKPEVSKAIKLFFYNEAELKQEAFNRYGFYFNSPYWLDASLKEQDPATLLRAYIVNEFILHVEQTKLFNGDIVFYSTKDGEAHKRFPSSGATGIAPMTDDWFVDALNNDPNTNLQSKNLGVNNPYSNVLKTTVFREQVPVSVYVKNWRAELASRGLKKAQIDAIVSEYEKGTKEADAQGWVTMDYYRSFKISIGDWRTPQENVYKRISQGQRLSTEEVEALGALFPPVKAQYAGPLAHEFYHVPAFHKFSLMPLLPSAIKGTALESLNERMIRNNMSYALMETGSKVGTIGNNLEPFYENREARTMKNPQTPFDNENLIHAAYLKEQVQIEPEFHDQVIFGTQFRKLLFQNVYSEGKAVSKKQAALEEEYSKLIDDITNYERDRLIQDMGVAPVMKDGKVVDYTVKDESKLLERIKKEVKRRKLNNSIKDFFELKDGKLKYPLDASLNHQQVRTLILSMINNRLIRQTIKGDMLIQGSGLGYEKLVKPTHQDILKYGTNGLSFYHVEDGKVRKMQVKTALTGDFKHLLNFKWKGETIGTIERLNEAIKDKDWVESNGKAITMIGYRIPTQGLNSIEAMEIAEFLPAEAGPILIVPTEIVTKSGSDFDIDKLNVFKPSLKTVNGEGEYVRRTEYKGTRKDIQDSIDPQIQELQAKKEAFGLYSDLNMDEKEKFMDELKNKLEITDQTLVEQLANVGRRMKELDRQIADSQQRVESFTNELRANYDPDMSDILVKERAYQMDLQIDLADELDKVAELKKNLLLQKVAQQNLSQASDLIDAMYDELFETPSKFNKTINNQINNLKADRKAQLDSEADYKFGLFNRLIEVATERLTDPEYFPQLISPNNTNIIKPIVNNIASKAGTDKKSYLHTNNLTSSTQEEKFLAGIPNKKALGIAAVANTMSQLFAKVGLEVNSIFKGRPVIHPMVKGLSMSNQTLQDGNLKSEIISQMINAYVDVLNDDFIAKANLSTDTAGAFFYLLHLGHSTKQLFDFFNTPIIKSYIAELQKTKSIISHQNDVNNQKAEQLVSSDFDDQDKPIGEIDQLVGSLAKAQAFRNVVGDTNNTKLEELRARGLELVKTKPEIFNDSNLESMLGKKLEDISKNERLAILSYYLNVLQESSDLLKLQQTNNYDTTTSVNPVANEFREQLKRELEDGNLFNTTDVTTPTVIKPFNQFGLISNILGSLMPVSLNAEVRKYIVTLLKDEKFQGDVDKLTRIFINDWVYSVAANFGETNSGQKIGDYGKALLFKIGSQETLSDQLVKLKTEEKWANLRQDYPMIGLLRPDTYNNLQNIALYREDNSAEYQNSLIEQFYKLGNFNDIGYSDEDKAYITRFFRNLAILSFVQSGLNKSPISFTDVIPNEFYAPIMSKALDKFKQLSKDDQRRAFLEFASKFRNNNTNLFGRRANPIPYWRFKDYSNTQLGKSVVKNHSMSYKMAANENLTGKDTSTVELSEQGLRTATTRSYALGKVGDIITFEGRPQQYRITGVEQLTKEKVEDPNWIKQWSDKEQWTIDHFRKVLGGSTVHVGSWQTSFEKINNVTSNTTQINFQEDQNSGYATRTRKNASADATIAIAVDFNSAGEQLTEKSVKGQDKVYLKVTMPKAYNIPSGTWWKSPGVQRLIAVQVQQLNKAKAKSLNIAGNGIYTFANNSQGYTQENLDEFVYQYIKELLSFPTLENKIESIRTGGQTGIDEAGAKAGIRLGIPTSILAPKGWKFRDINGNDISDEAQFKARFDNIQPETLEFSLNSGENVVSLQEGTFQALLNSLQEDGLLTKCK